MLPGPPESEEQDETPPEPPPPDQPPCEEEQPESEDRAEQPEAMPDIDEIILAAAAAAIPPGLLATLQLEGNRRRLVRAADKAGHLQKAKQRGRPLGTRPGQPRGGNRLALVDTLRAAAPWQKLRRCAPGPGDGPRRVVVRPDDPRITQFKQRNETLPRADAQTLSMAVKSGTADLRAAS